MWATPGVKERGAKIDAALGDDHPISHIKTNRIHHAGASEPEAQDDVDRPGVRAALIPSA